MKAAEILLNAKTPGQLHSKAKVMLKLFPKAPLPPEFTELVNNFNPSEFTGPSMEWKLDLFKTIVANYDRKESIIKLWKQIFPGDTWIDRFQTSESPSSAQSGS